MVQLSDNDRNIKFFWVSFVSLFVVSFPFIDRTNSYFYIFIFLAWLCFSGLAYFLLASNMNYDYSGYMLLTGFSMGLILNFSSSFTLSEDIYRYLFDGFLVKHHINPYLYAPSSEFIKPLVNTFPYFDKINNPTISSPYPPLAIAFSFLFVVFIGYAPHLWLLTMNIITVFTGYILLQIFEKLQYNKNLIVLWSLNPNILLEFDHSGHNDVISIFFLVLAIYYLVNKEKPDNKLLILAGLFLSLSIGFKIFTFIFLPFLLYYLCKIGSITAIVLTGVQYFVFFLLINLKFSGIIVFLQYWRFNGGLFEGLFFLFNNFNSSNLNVSLESQLRLFFVVLFIVLFLSLLVNFYKTKKYEKTITIVFMYIGFSYIALFMFSPVLHPWYLLWAVVPFILSEKAFLPYWVFLFLVNISYYYYLDASLSIILIVIEYTIFYLFMAYYIMKHKMTDFC